MRETERSLRAYFFVFGGGALLLRFVALSMNHAIPAELHGTLAGYFGLANGFVFEVLYLAAGVQLRQALASGPRWIRHMLVASAAASLIQGALVASVRGPRGSDVLVAAFTMLIAIYLYRNVTRLAADAMARAGTPAPPPTAKLV